MTTNPTPTPDTGKAAGPPDEIWAWKGDTPTRSGGIQASVVDPGHHHSVRYILATPARLHAQEAVEALREMKTAFAVPGPRSPRQFAAIRSAAHILAKLEPSK